MDVEFYHVPFSQRLRHEQQLQHPGGFHPPTFKIDDGRSVFATYYYGWKEGSPDYQGIGVGFKYSF